MTTLPMLILPQMHMFWPARPVFLLPAIHCTLHLMLKFFLLCHKPA